MRSFIIVHEDKHFVIADKLAAIPVQRDKTGDISLQELLAREAKGFLEACHRIDRRASGLVAFAKSRAAFALASRLIAERKFDKTYSLVVEAEPEKPEGRLVHRLTRDARRNITVAHPSVDADPERPDTAILDYRVTGKSERYWFVEARPITGRTHQIRAQMAAIGCVIRGDIKYGSKRTNKNRLIMLHARKLAFVDEFENRPIEVLAPYPDTENLWKAAPDWSEEEALRLEAMQGSR
jgi:23S rRNA pseudouridine1911/1915/1917 synthase